MDDNVRLLTLDSDNKSHFINVLSAALEERFKTAIETIDENYGRKHPWSLLSLIENNGLDTYQILYHNNLLWSASGGIVREFNGERVYQGGFRGLSYYENRHNGIGVNPLTAKYCIKHQIERAKINNCSKFIISFNEYNHKLFRVFHKYQLTKVFGPDAFEPSQTPVIFNSVPQWLLSMQL